MRLTIALVGLLAANVYAHEPSDIAEQCESLHRMSDVTIIYADHVEAQPAHCYAKGLINGSITFHVVLPVANDWNGRLVHLGDGGADGDLDRSDALLAQGYALVNSNTGHDTGAEPRVYAFQNERAAMDFSYWAVHVATGAAKTIVRSYYEKPQEYAYHFGCSTGGRQGLVAAQLFPYDFDGIVAGAPGHRQFSRMAHRLTVEQRLFREGFAGNLAYDADGDGVQESLAKLDLLASVVTASCDAADGITDGVIEPELCDIDMDDTLAAHRCSDDGPNCFTDEQMAAIHHLYEGSRDDSDDLIYPGAPLGSEPQWRNVFIPHAGNDLTPYVLRSASAVIGYSFFARDPGLIPPDLSDIDYRLDTDAALPEWGWWNFDINDIDGGTLSAQTPMMEANDPDLERFLLRNRGKLLIWHGWADAVIPPEPSIDYHRSVVDSVFDGDTASAHEHVQLYMAPGVAHCRGGPGPDTADYLGVLRAWVEDGVTPASIPVLKVVNGAVENERLLCPYPQRAVYRGPAGGANDRSNWVAANFSCE